jgi:DNA-binding NarL/FixJ family response regulator
MVEQRWALFLIEAHPDVQRALSARLERDRELHVAGRSTFLPSAESLQSANPDVVLLGLSQRYQHDLSWLENTIRAITAIAPVIVLTPYVDDAERQRLLAAGAADYFLKTIDSEALIGVVKGVAAARVPVTGQPAPLVAG